MRTLHFTFLSSVQTVHTSALYLSSLFWPLSGRPYTTFPIRLHLLKTYRKKAWRFISSLVLSSHEASEMSSAPMCWKPKLFNSLQDYTAVTLQLCATETINHVYKYICNCTAAAFHTLPNNIFVISLLPNALPERIQCMTLTNIEIASSQQSKL